MTTKRTPAPKRPPPRRATVEVPPIALEAVTCGFCEGSGRDPFGIMSHLSSCCVCGGSGTVSIKKPYVRCAFCEGTGVYPTSRLTCTACGGAGVRSVPEPHEPCSHCQGTGAERTTAAHLWCLACHGAGVVTPKGGLVSVAGAS